MQLQFNPVDCAFTVIYVLSHRTIVQVCQFDHLEDKVCGFYNGKSDMNVSTELYWNKLRTVCS